jgi:hypothetical protein
MRGRELGGSMRASHPGREREAFSIASVASAVIRVPRTAHLIRVGVCMA